MQNIDHIEVCGAMCVRTDVPFRELSPAERDYNGRPGNIRGNRSPTPAPSAPRRAARA